MSLENRIQAKIARVHRLVEEPENVERMFRLFRYWDEDTERERPERADVALCLGTSRALYPPAFQERVDTCAGLFKAGLVKTIVFTGSFEPGREGTENQAEESCVYAMSAHDIPPDHILCVGGSNTQENFEETLPLLKDLEAKTIFLVSHWDHLMRSVPITHSPEYDTMQFFPYSVPESEPCALTDAFLIALIKGIMYNRTLFRRNPDIALTPADREQIDKEVENVVARLTMPSTHPS